MTVFDLLKHTRDYGELIEAIMRALNVSRTEAYEIAAKEFGRPRQDHGGDNES